MNRNKCHLDIKIPVTLDIRPFKKMKFSEKKMEFSQKMKPRKTKIVTSFPRRKFKNAGRIIFELFSGSISIEISKISGFYFSKVLTKVLFFINFKGVSLLRPV